MGSRRFSRWALFAAGTTLALVTSADVSSVGVGSAVAGIVNGAPTTLSFPIMRTGDSSYAVVAAYATEDGSAVAGADYTATKGTILIPPGTGNAPIPVPVTGPAGLHPDKQFALKLTGAAGIGPAASFAAEQVFTAGSEPYAVTAIDINGDGKPDLIVANINDNTVSVFLNTTASGAGTLTFASQQSFNAGAAPSFVIATDINGDGRPDLVVADNFGSSVSVLINTTAAGSDTPSFAAAQQFACAFSPVSVAAADLNGDGKIDLVVGTDGGNVSILLNTTVSGAPAASFHSQQTFATNSIYPLSVALADLDGDGKPDLILANSSDAGSNGVSVLLNTTQSGAAVASFAAQQDFATGSGPRALTVADLDGDGRPDLIVANANDRTVSVLLNTTATATGPSFSAQQAFAVGNYPDSTAVADLNGDGKPDLVVVNGLDNTLSVLLNTTVPGSSAAAFAQQETFAAGTAPYSAIAADLNGDGKPDLALVNVQSPGGTVATLTNITTFSSTGYGVQIAAASGIGTIHYQSNIPSAFSFPPVIGALPGSTQTSAGIIVSGTNLPSAISVNNGFYSINAGAFTAEPSMVNPGDTVMVQAIAASTAGAQVQATLNIGGVSASFSVTTTAQQASSGGGAIGPWLLALLGGALLWRCRRERFATLG